MLVIWKAIFCCLGHSPLVLMPLERNITSSTHATQVFSVHPHYYMSNQQTKVQVPKAEENLLPCHILHLSIYINYFLARVRSSSHENYCHCLAYLGATHLWWAPWLMAAAVYVLDFTIPQFLRQQYRNRIGRIHDNSQSTNSIAGCWTYHEPCHYISSKIQQLIAVHGKCLTLWSSLMEES